LVLYIAEAPILSEPERITMNKMPCTFAILAMATALADCGGCNSGSGDTPDASLIPDTGPLPVPAQTTVEPTQFLNWGKYEAGEVCVGSDLDSAPIFISDRDQIIKILSVTYGCFTLQPGLYQVEPQDVKTYLGTPPKTDLLQVKNGLRYDIFFKYNKTAETESKAVVEPMVYTNTEKAFPAGQLCVDSDLGGAPFQIVDRNGVLVITSTTTSCFTLQPGGYTVRYLKVKDLEFTPPDCDVQMKDCDDHLCKGVYAPK
jgi:hypothetical protein